MFTFVLLVCIGVSAVSARCWCAEFVRSSDSRWIRKLDTGCHDYEMQAECKRAEFEMVDWVNAVMAYARTISVAHPANSSEEDARNQAALSYAVEAHRPVPDCATGLFTTRTLSGDNWEHEFEDDDDDSFERGSCASKELFDECVKVRDGIDAYMKSVMTELEAQKASSAFIEIMRLRVEKSIVPTVTCKTYEYHRSHKVSDDAGNHNARLSALLAGFCGVLVWHGYF